MLVGGNIKIAILCHKKTPENMMIYEKLKDNHDVSFLDSLNVVFGLKNNKNNNYDYDLIISRVERDYLLEGIYALKYIESIANENNIKIINSSECIEVCQNKYLTYIKLKELMPESFLTYTGDFENIKNTLKNNNFEFPVVVKPIYGGYGNGVLRIGSMDELKNIFEILKFNKREIFIQKYIPYKHDIRALVVGDKIIGAMERIPKNDWRANYSLGAEIKRFDLDAEVKNMVLKSVKKVSAGIVGVDILIDENNKPYILEMNITPQFRGIMHFVDVPEEILKYIEKI
ncbi:ATP-grasp domain-containing protein [Methanothermococcus okinawensis]|uniref:Alpha-L-glutamate ligase, RimK family n=1 Tax=Methanothermococcus okinawensis (strain DSM 14208 / JCM 11175 / IH1) TaxID=647113 RepID=F8ANW7_METOI|nr:RimK family alpha-L-glutamate ligase [Methanothermococcus okinawensis]AEH07108.1 alpha-L-glutamate ligase, RimK family [Methanothermococcus okinawensis IH1]